MASGDTLLEFHPYHNEPPISNYATLGVRNQHPHLAFDQTTAEAALFAAVLPRNYTSGGITVYVHWATSATSGTIGWTVEWERIGDGQQDLDSDGFGGSIQTITAATVPGTAGMVDITNVACTDGANIDSIAVGEYFRMRIKRDVANDTATSDAELYAVELKET